MSDAVHVVLEKGARAMRSMVAVVIAVGVGLIKVCVDWLLTGASSGVSFILAMCLALIALAAWILVERWGPQPPPPPPPAG